MKKIKQWIKNHKKDIGLFILAVGGTSTFFLIKEGKLKCIHGYFSLNFNISTQRAGGYNLNDSTFYQSFNLDDPDISVGDLGKLGDVLKKYISGIGDETKLTTVSASFNDVIKKAKNNKKADKWR